MAGVGYLGGTLTGPLWVDSFQWQKTALLIILTVTFSFLVSMRIPGEYIYYGFLIFGFFCALAIALSMRALADMPDPERAYGTRLSVELFSIGLFLVFLPAFFVSKAGFTGAMFGMALFTMLLGIGVFVFPKHSSSRTAAKLKGFPSFRQSGSSWSVLMLSLIHI